MEEMPRPALPAEHWQAQEDARLSALLSWDAFVPDRIGEPIELSLMLALTNLSMTSRAATLIEELLAAAAHEDSWLVS